MTGVDEVQKFVSEPSRPNVHLMNEHVVDVLILTARKDELDAVLSLGQPWTECRDAKGVLYHRSVQPGGLVVAAAWIGEMGQRATAVRGQTLLDELKPTCLAMCGVCAGDPQKVSLGDIVVADQLWAYEEGKREDGTLDHSIRTFDLELAWRVDVCNTVRQIPRGPIAENRPPTKDAQMRWLLRTLYAHQFEGGPSPAEHDDRKNCCPGYPNVLKEIIGAGSVVRQGRSITLTDAGKDRVEEDMLLHPDGFAQDREFRVHIGTLASGSAVIEDDNIFSRLRPSMRKTYALDMEGVAIAQLAEQAKTRFLVVKAVQDFANAQKDDTFRAFACHASAQFLLEMLRQLVQPRINTPTIAKVEHEQRPIAEQAEHVVLYAPKSLQAVWQNFLPKRTNPQLLVIETPEKRWYWDEPRESPVWSSVFRHIEACADAVVQSPNRTLHVFTMLPYGFGAALGAMVLAAYRRRGNFVIYQNDYTTNAWAPWGPYAAAFETAPQAFPIPSELTGSPDLTVRDAVLVIRVSRRVVETEIERSTDVPKDATWIRATLDEVGTKVIRSPGDIESLVDWLGKLVDECGRKYPNASIHLFYVGPQAAFIRAGEHFALSGRRMTIYDRNRTMENELRFLPIVRFEAGRVKRLVGDAPATRGTTQEPCT